MSEIMPAHHHLATGTPRQQLRAAEQAFYEWLTPRQETEGAVPVTQQELARLRFLVECISRIAEGALLAGDSYVASGECAPGPLPEQAQEATS